MWKKKWNVWKKFGAKLLEFPLVKKLLKKKFHIFFPSCFWLGKITKFPQTNSLFLNPFIFIYLFIYIFWVCVFIFDPLISMSQNIFKESLAIFYFFFHFQFCQVAILVISSTRGISQIQLQVIDHSKIIKNPTIFWRLA